MASTHKTAGRLLKASPDLSCHFKFPMAESILDFHEEAKSKTHREYRRAYKACENCRKRKSRCVISAEEYASGFSCARCRREMKQCTFGTSESDLREIGIFHCSMNYTEVTDKFPRVSPG